MAKLKKLKIDFPLKHFTTRPAMKSISAKDAEAITVITNLRKGKKRDRLKQKTALLNAGLTAGCSRCAGLYEIFTRQSWKLHQQWHAEKELKEQQVLKSQKTDKSISDKQIMQRGTKRQKSSVSMTWDELNLFRPLSAGRPGSSRKH